MSLKKMLPVYTGYTLPKCDARHSIRASWRSWLYGRQLISYNPQTYLNCWQLQSVFSAVCHTIHFDFVSPHLSASLDVFAYNECAYWPWTEQLLHNNSDWHIISTSDGDYNMPS